MIEARSEDPLAVLIRDYYADPLGFVLDCFDWGDEAGEGPDEWQAEFLRDIGREVSARAFDGRTPVEPICMAIASGHGIGKSTVMAWVFWWIMCTRAEAKGRVTANTYTQLETTTWAEIQKWHRKLICREWFEVSGSKVYHKEAKESWFAVPITCTEENSEAFAGQHNRESTSFYLFDESSLIPDSIWRVARQGMTDGEPMWFAFGNPTRNTGAFYDACFGEQIHRWNQRSIDARYCRFPNKGEQDKLIADYGMDSDEVRMRILGQPPKQSELQLISRRVVEEAQQRQVAVLDDEPLIAGMDVPDGGSAWWVIRFRRGLDTRPGPTIPAPIRMPGARTDRAMMIAQCAKLLRDEHPKRRIAMMFVDAAFGAAIVVRLQTLGFDNVIEVSFGGKSPDPHYANMRAYMWGKEMKDWLARGAIDPEDKKLKHDLCAPGFHHKVGGDGALVVESKDEMKSHGIASPDDGDALALTFAAPVAPPSRDGDNEVRRRIV